MIRVALGSGPSSQAFRVWSLNDTTVKPDLKVPGTHPEDNLTIQRNEVEQAAQELGLALSNSPGLRGPGSDSG